MSLTAAADQILFDRTGLDLARAERLTAEALAGADDGELFLEHAQSESLVFDDGRLKTANYDVTQGFGLRAVAGEVTGYAHASDLSDAAIARAAETVRAVRAGHGGALALAPARTNAKLYVDDNPVSAFPFADKVALVAAVDAYARSRDPRVRQVSVSLVNEWRVISILRGDGWRGGDVRPLVRLQVTIVVEEGGRREVGSQGAGGRVLFDRYAAEGSWQAQVDEALRQALVNLGSIPAPAGEMPVVLGGGWAGVLLHEAVGHGLEGDFNRKGTSAFAGLMGQRVAAPGVTVVDDGTLPDRRGSLTVDDEGTPTSRTVLIEDGILTGYIQDRLNARLMGMRATGNGRRQSYAHAPMPRMTNTLMLSGDKKPEEIVAAVKKGLYAVNFGGGQVDITSGKFVFELTEAYMIEDGRIGPAVKGATLIGNGPDALTRITMIGDDSRLDDGVGTCGKDGQAVPVGVGQPSMLISAMTVGGTAA